MSLSVDDLVSSLSSSHIGQEAIDLAALQAQLAQAFFGQPSTAQRPKSRRNTQACNTPISRSPSTNHSFSHMASRPMEDFDEERMVEDLLMPSSPTYSTAPQYQFQPHHATSSHQPTSPLPNHSSSYFPVSPEPTTTSSVFTSTDPFYLAAMQQQQQQQQQQSTSFFAQTGRLAQNSPFFVRQTQQHRENYPLTIDTHSIFASAY